MDFDAAYDAWIGYLAEHGFAATRFLSPPASEDELDAAEAVLGFALPTELRRLWRRANGQQDVFATTDPSPGTIICPLFGGYEFQSVSQALVTYQGWMDIYTDAGASFDENFNGEAMIQRRDHDPVHREYWRPGWLPFSLDGGGNSYAADCSPAPGGTYGQVIVIGPDEDLRRVLAPGLSSFLADAAARRPPIAPAADGGPHVFFEMEERRR